jgi:hypothetical protein
VFIFIFSSLLLCKLEGSEHAVCGSAWDERVGEFTIKGMGREPVLFSSSMKDGRMKANEGKKQRSRERGMDGC